MVSAAVTMTTSITNLMESANIIQLVLAALLAPITRAMAGATTAILAAHSAKIIPKRAFRASTVVTKSRELNANAVTPMMVINALNQRFAQTTNM